MKWARLVGYPVVFAGGYGWIARNGLDLPTPVWIGIMVLGLASGIWVWRREYAG
jgi:hypothetical protein